MYMEFKTCDTIEYLPIPLTIDTEKLSTDTEEIERLFEQSFDIQGFFHLNGRKQEVFLWDGVEGHIGGQTHRFFGFWIRHRSITKDQPQLYRK